ncbi:hypothetical protein [Listeria grayi]|uniref:hypothetical protein n=1 Tax=Listeria grayi TaxID=1641 RepID=UPI002113C45A|nr:hypothetical protein [Listeria grayi]
MSQINGIMGNINKGNTTKNGSGDNGTGNSWDSYKVMINKTAIAAVFFCWSDKLCCKMI